ncbi:hypothetical protein GCM10010123_07610 [Pilimelia anulata]|uniref:Uncharacterized protein n=1 Tax=Pilimelia anulata TaxID=53371 RepID=A0A8J3B0W7_9ACTN|nr:hypothetical protein [Pilimelia anulata]GGJ80201.1 hypothetical protein GCM10010123_07610 [Pilimelia anulata]
MSGTPTDRAPFVHRPPLPAALPTQMSAVTRYMCAAAYLLPAFARTVVTELVDRPHRAVAPSIGFDLGPVLAHCLNARRLELLRDGLLAAVLLVGLFVLPHYELWLLAALVVGVYRLGRRRFRRRTALVLALVVLVPVAMTVGATLLTALTAGLAAPTGSGFPASPDAGATGGSAEGTDLLVRLALLAVLAMAIQYGWQVVVRRLLIQDLGPTRRPRPVPLPDNRTGRRVADVAAAQFGNLALQAHSRPFLGAGPQVNAWSMSLELRGRSGHPVTVDPVALHDRVRERLAETHAAKLPPRERISGLALHDMIIGVGERPWSDPLIDERTCVPYSEVTRAAIPHVIRHPQGSLRYYRRISAHVRGTEIMTDGGPIIGAEDREVVVSAFLYAAVEGGLLHLELMTHVLPPLVRHLHAVDHLSTDNVWLRSLGGSLLAAPLAMLAAPVGLLGNAYTAYRRDAQIRRTADACREQPINDHGAGVSVRELAAADGFGDSIQGLDARKYSKIIERTVTAAVLTFLTEQGVDTAEYRDRAAVILNAGVTINGGTFHGPVAAGANPTATQHRATPPNAA